MSLIERHTTIAAPIQLVYRVTQDYSIRYRWDPFPEDIAIVSGPADGLSVGTRVRVRSKLGMAMQVEFVQVLPPFRTAIRMVQGPWFLQKFAGTWILQEVDAGATNVRFRYLVLTRPATLRFFVEPIVRLYFTAVVERRLAGLKAYCETRP
jgi:uncharacterized protein YndB with AHSA1/START domain